MKHRPFLFGNNHAGVKHADALGLTGARAPQELG